MAVGEIEFIELVKAYVLPCLLTYMLPDIFPPEHSPFPLSISFNEQ